MNVEEAIKALGEAKKCEIIVSKFMNKDEYLEALEVSISVLTECLTYGLYTNKQECRTIAFPDYSNCSYEQEIVIEKIVRLLYLCNANYNDAFNILNMTLHSIGRYYSIKI